MGNPDMGTENVTCTCRITLSFANAKYDYWAHTYQQVMDSSTSSLSSLSTDRSTGSSQSVTKSKPILSTHQHICNALETLCEGCFSPFDLLLKVLDLSEEEFSGYHECFYMLPKAGTISKLDKLLDMILADPQGQKQFIRWMEPHAISLVTDKVFHEMDEIKANLRSTIDAITPDLSCSAYTPAPTVMYSDDKVRPSHLVKPHLCCLKTFQW